MNLNSLTAVKPKWRSAVLSSLLALSMTACAVGPDYHQPELAPVTLKNADATIAQGYEARWWSQFGDSTLDALIQQAVASNLDLKQALARVAAARAAVGEAHSNLLPTVSTDASFTRSRLEQPGFTKERVGISQYQGGFDASWEVDVFGGIRRSVESARAQAQATDAQLRDVQVRVIAEVARNYFELRGTQLRLDIASRDLDTQVQTVKLTQARRDIGSGLEQDVASAAARLAATQAQIPLLVASSDRSKYRLAVLLGVRPGELNVDLSPKSFTAISHALAIGAPGDVLARRPDVRVAERDLASATANVGVAQADFYPHIEVGGFIGFLSGSSADIGSVASHGFSIGPSITWNGLNFQRVQSRLHERKANADEALANYQQTVLLALEDIEGSLTEFNQERVRTDHLIEQAKQSRRAADLAAIRYKEGATDFLTLLDAQRTALSAEDDLAQAETAINTSTIAVYKALGGGWEACGDAQCSQLASAGAAAGAP
ncbi:MAG: efflux transporter, outer rane factor lipoprotein NodT family [Nevskia sp.]|nr:efflux transporter, outer rane factor lipoprotein NodT family [Nevskia sp.]